MSDDNDIEAWVTRVFSDLDVDDCTGNVVTVDGRDYTLWFDTDNALVAIQVEARRVREVGETSDTVAMETVWTCEEPFTVAAQKVYLAWALDAKLEQIHTGLKRIRENLQQSLKPQT